MQDKLVILIPGIIALVGALLVFLGLRARQLARASLEWPSTPGKVVRSDIVVSEDRDENTSQVRRTYTARVEYEYTVNMCDYKGNRVRFGLGGSSNHTLIKGIVDRYPVGATVDVYYDPGKPDRCTLDRTAGSGTFLAILGSCLIVGAVLIGGLVWALGE